VKILNLYAGIGGNRGAWGNDHDITSVELDPRIAAAYATLWPQDTIIVDDAHQYLLEHYTEFDFIWSSPPCPTHSRMQTLQVGGKGKSPVYPDGMLFEEVAFLAHWAKVPYVVENVIPYYGEVLAGAQRIDRHLYWANFHIPALPKRADERLRALQIADLEVMHGVDLAGIRLADKRKVLRNMVPAHVGLHILEAAFDGRLDFELASHNLRTNP
jgi:DNA (cytosine-5)-methyltransferase 1